MTRRTALAVLCLSLIAFIGIDGAGAGCAIPKDCNIVDDRLEVELAVPLNPDALTSTGVTSLPALAPLTQLLSTHHAQLQPSIPAKLAQKLSLLRYYTIRFPPGVHKTPTELAAIRRALRALSSTIVRRAEFVPAARPPADDPYVGATRSTVVDDEKTPCGTQWYVQATGVDVAWNCGATGKGVVVADVDWGFMTDHDDLKGAFDLAHAHDICADTNNLNDGDPKHGTGVAGLIAARKNGTGTQGIAYETTIWPIQAACVSNLKIPCDESWGAAENPWATAIASVTVDGCDSCRKVLLLEVQTCCKGSYEGSLAVSAAIKAAIANNVVVVIAAGNGDRDASCNDFGESIEETGAIVVGATSYGDTNPRNLSSNFGDRILVSAPGAESQDLTTTTKDWKCVASQGDLAAYTPKFGGTSGAAAKVAAVVALMLEKNPSLSPGAVGKILKDTGGVVDTSMDPTKKAGVFLNAGAAVAAADPGRCKKEP